jgi:hypothetical protein
MSLRDVILQLVQIAIFFAFPAIWSWLTKIIPWWPLDPETTLNLLVYLAITVVSWLLGYLGIKRFIKRLQTQGLAADFQKAS